jgi:hypothetical protein
MRERSGETSHWKCPALKNYDRGGNRDYIKRLKYLTTSLIVEFATADKECLGKDARA